MTTTKGRPAKNNTENDLVNQILDALYTARRAYSLMPPVPDGMRAQHMAVLSFIHRIAPADGSGVRVSDITQAMKAHAPNTTKLVNELEQFRAVRKTTLAQDKRVVLVSLTPLGEQYVEDLVLKHHQKLKVAFAKVGRERCVEMIDTINQIYNAMRNIY